MVQIIIDNIQNFAILILGIGLIVHIIKHPH